MIARALSEENFGVCCFHLCNSVLSLSSGFQWLKELLERSSGQREYHDSNSRRESRSSSLFLSFSSLPKLVNSLKMASAQSSDGHSNIQDSPSNSDSPGNAQKRNEESSRTRYSRKAKKESDSVGKGVEEKEEAKETTKGELG